MLFHRATGLLYEVKVGSSHQPGRPVFRLDPVVVLLVASLGLTTEYRATNLHVLALRGPVFYSCSTRNHTTTTVSANFLLLLCFC